MRIQIICVGRLKEKYFEDAQAEYVKMLRRFCTVDIVEVKDETPKSPSAADESAARDEEGRRILARLKSFVIACSPKGKTLSSEEFSSYLESLSVRGVSDISFVVGGSTGLSREVLDRADLVLSFSAMTMPHRLFRVVLLEQIYRAFKISSGQTYHK